MIIRIRLSRRGLDAAMRRLHDGHAQPQPQQQEQEQYQQQHTQQTQQEKAQTRQQQQAKTRRAPVLKRGMSKDSQRVVPAGLFPRRMMNKGQKRKEKTTDEKEAAIEQEEERRRSHYDVCKTARAEAQETMRKRREFFDSMHCHGGGHLRSSSTL